MVLLVGFAWFLQPLLQLYPVQVAGLRYPGSIPMQLFPYCSLLFRPVSNLRTLTTSESELKLSTEIERNPVTAFQIAASFLTRFPMGHGGRHYHRPLAASVWIFAIVGALVGFCGALIFCAGTWIGFPVWLTALASVAGMYFFTGGLHEDGLADVADGFWGGSNKEQKLRIMRDSRVGSYGVTALTFSVFARTAVLASLPSASIAAVAMIAAGALSRGAIGIPMVALPTARVDGLSVSAGKPGYMHALSGLGVAFLIVWASSNLSK